MRPSAAGPLPASSMDQNTTRHAPSSQAWPDHQSPFVALSSDAMIAKLAEAEALLRETAGLSPLVNQLETDHPAGTPSVVSESMTKLREAEASCRAAAGLPEVHAGTSSNDQSHLAGHAAASDNMMAKLVEAEVLLRETAAMAAPLANMSSPSSVIFDHGSKSQCSSPASADRNREKKTGEDSPSSEMLKPVGVTAAAVTRRSRRPASAPCARRNTSSSKSQPQRIALTQQAKPPAPLRRRRQHQDLPQHGARQLERRRSLQRTAREQDHLQWQYTQPRRQPEFQPPPAHARRKQVSCGCAAPYPTAVRKESDHVVTCRPRTRITRRACSNHGSDDLRAKLDEILCEFDETVGRW